MIFEYELCLNQIWKGGKIEAACVERAAQLIRRIHQLEGQEHTIVLYENVETKDNII